MKTIIARRLAPLGSPELQTRYIEHGTKHSYLLIEDILNDAYDCIRIARDFPSDRTGLTEREIAEIIRIEPLLDAIDLDDGRSNHTVLSSPEWANLSSFTRSVIKTCGFSLPEIVKGLEFGKPNKTRHATARSRFVEMIYRNYNINPVSDTRPRS